MSAYQVSPYHIGAIVRWYLDDCPTYSLRNWRGHTANGTDAGDMMGALALECFKSVSYRYPAEDGQPLDLPGPIAFKDRPVECPHTLSAYQRLTPVQVIKAIHGYIYQACEHPEWEQSEARRLVQQIESCALRVLPGYEEAEWEITEPAPSYRPRPVVVKPAQFVWG